MEDKWPRYVPVTFATGVNVSPEDLATLNRAKLPEIALGAGKILAVPIGIFIPDRGYLIQLAHGGYEGIYYDPSTGRVVAIHDWPGPDPRLVNSTLRQYTSTVKAITSTRPGSTPSR